MSSNSFVYDWHGIRWFCELGNEDYSAGGYWDFERGRWLYYTQRAEGHNAIVINPDGEPDQYIYATASVDAVDDTTGVVDITKAYPDLRCGTREFSLNDDIAVIEDELNLNNDATIYWFMHTDADVKITGENTALLTKNGSSVSVEFELPEGAELSIMDAKPLFPELSFSTSTLNGIKKICVRVSGNGKISLVTKIIPQK